MRCQSASLVKLLNEYTLASQKFLVGASVVRKLQVSEREGGEGRGDPQVHSFSLLSLSLPAFFSSHPVQVLVTAHKDRNHIFIHAPTHTSKSEREGYQFVCADHFHCEQMVFVKRIV